MIKLPTPYKLTPEIWYRLLDCNGLTEIYVADSGKYKVRYKGTSNTLVEYETDEDREKLVHFLCGMLYYSLFVMD